MMQLGAAPMGEAEHGPFCRIGRRGYLSNKFGATVMIESIMYFGLGFCAAGLSVVLLGAAGAWPRSAADGATA
jgi:hypothetical protein